MENMRLFKVITVLISILLSSTALAGSKSLKETEGHIGNMPPPKWLGDDLKYSMPAFLFRQTQLAHGKSVCTWATIGLLGSRRVLL